jgi:hypothetical protein
VIATATPNALAELAARLTDPQDRETYAALISFIDSLPENDELFRMAQLLGLLSLLGQRIPDAVTGFLKEFRAQTASSAKYHADLERRLARLPEEIGAGVDAGAIAKAMSESFRQQIAATGLQDTALHLQICVTEVKGLSDQIATALKPVPQQYKGIGATISTELAKLQSAASQLQQHNARLIVQTERNAWMWKVLAVAAVFLVGAVCGSVYEQGQRADLLTEIDAQIHRSQPPAPLAPPGAVIPKRKKVQ